MTDNADENENLGRTKLSATIRFEDDRHRQLHQKAKQQFQTTSDAEIVQAAHEVYLEQLAEKHDWDVDVSVSRCR
jgi:hypothetical protein